MRQKPKVNMEEKVKTARIYLMNCLAQILGEWNLFSLPS